MAPSLGKIMIFTVNPHNPHTPPSHDHHGSFENNSMSINIPPFSQRVMIRRKIVPTENDTSEATNGDITDCLKREFAAVCMGVSTPKKNIGIRYHIINRVVVMKNSAVFKFVVDKETGALIGSNNNYCFLHIIIYHLIDGVKLYQIINNRVVFRLKYMFPQSSNIINCLPFLH